jgi:hypothetical protein
MYLWNSLLLAAFDFSSERSGVEAGTIHKALAAKLVSLRIVTATDASVHDESLACSADCLYLGTWRKFNAIVLRQMQQALHVGMTVDDACRGREQGIVGFHRWFPLLQLTPVEPLQIVDTIARRFRLQRLQFINYGFSRDNQLAELSASDAMPLAMFIEESFTP